MQRDTIIVVPAREGLVVIDPATQKAIEAGGAEVPRNGYWTKRLQQGDVVIVEPVERDKRKRAGAS